MSDNIVKNMFLLEEKYWNYIDSGNRFLKFPKFISIINNRFPHILNNSTKIALQQFKIYKKKLPVYGAILLNKYKTKFIIVKGYNNYWTFPCGKINDSDKNGIYTAKREVFEEIGYPIRYIDPNKYICLDRFKSNAKIKLYIVPDVPENFHFQPHTKNEIKEIKWLDIKNADKYRLIRNVIKYL